MVGKELYKEMNSDHLALLNHTVVRWLSKSNVVIPNGNVLKLKEEIAKFLRAQGRF